MYQPDGTSMMMELVPNTEEQIQAARRAVDVFFPDPDVKSEVLQMLGFEPYERQLVNFYGHPSRRIMSQ